MDKAVDIIKCKKSIEVFMSEKGITNSFLNKKVIKARKVRDILKKLHLTKYYEHCHYITNRITGRPAPEIDEELQEKIRDYY